MSQPPYCHVWRVWRQSVHSSVWWWHHTGLSCSAARLVPEHPEDARPSIWLLQDCQERLQWDLSTPAPKLEAGRGKWRANQCPLALSELAVGCWVPGRHICTPHLKHTACAPAQGPLKWLQLLWFPLSPHNPSVSAAVKRPARLSSQLHRGTGMLLPACLPSPVLVCPYTLKPGRERKRAPKAMHCKWFTWRIAKAKQRVRLGAILSW